MKKGLTLLIALFVCLSIPKLVLADELTIVGTGDGVKILNAIGEAFMQSNPDIEIKVPKSIGSGGGIKAVGTGQEQIGRVARELKEKEKPYGLSYTPYARGPVVFFVNKGVGIKDLSAEQVCGIYSGEITNWKDVGGKDTKIRVVRREDGDSSLKVLRKSFPGFGGISITVKSKTTFSTPETFSIVEKKANAIGFGPYDVAKDADVDIIAIEGKAPADSGYPYFSTLAVIYKAEKLTGNLKKFLEFATSSVAHKSIVNAGGTPF